VERGDSQNTAVAVAVAGVCGDEADQQKHTVQATHCPLLTLIEKGAGESSWTEIPCERMIWHSSRGVHVSCVAWPILLVLQYGNLQKQNVCYAVTL
jgi:hypothetical protein